MVASGKVGYELPLRQSEGLRAAVALARIHTCVLKIRRAVLADAAKVAEAFINLPVKRLAGIKIQQNMTLSSKYCPSR